MTRTSSRRTLRSIAFMAGSDLRSPEGFGPLTGGQNGVAPGHETIFAAYSFCLCSIACSLVYNCLAFPLTRTGRRTRYRTILGSSRSAVHAGFAPENVIVTGQEMGAESPLRC